jgi:hypothetical protein
MKGTWQTTGSSGLSGGVILAVIAAVWLIGSGALSAIVHAIAVVLIIFGCTIAVAVLGLVAALIMRTRSDRLTAPISGRVVPSVPPEPAPQLTEPYKPAAIEPTTRNELHLHFHGMTRAEVGDAIRDASRKEIT